jgi:hypothetical protein
VTESTAPPAKHAEGVKSAPPGEVTTEPPQPFIPDLVFARMAENPVSGIARVPVASLADGAGPEQVVEARRLHQDQMKTVRYPPVTTLQAGGPPRVVGVRQTTRTQHNLGSACKFRPTSVGSLRV